jgi:hypothetical protein
MLMAAVQLLQAAMQKMRLNMLSCLLGALDAALFTIIMLPIKP